MDPLIDSIVNPGNSNADANIGRSQDPLIDSIVNPPAANPGRMSLAFEAGINTPPDRAARVIRAQSRTGLPADLIEQDLERIEIEMKKQDFNPERFRASSPMVAEWMAKNPQNAALAQDDLENLERVEGAVSDYGFMSSMHTALDKGLATALGGIARVPGLAYDVAAYPQNLAVRAGILPESFQVTSKDLPVENRVASFYEKAAQDFSNPDLEASFVTEMGKGNYSRAGRAFAAGVVSNAPNMVAMMAVALGAGPGAASAYAFGTSAASKNEENLQAGVDPTVALPNALATGSIEVAAENLSFGSLGVIRKEAQRMTARYGASATREAIKEGFLTIAKSMGQEGSEEAITSIAQDLTDYVTGVNPDALDGIFTRAGDAFAIGTGSGATMTAPAARAAAAQRSRQIRQANAARDFYNALGDSVEATKLRQRLPEAQRDLVDQITKGTGVENIYVPVAAMESYFQERNIPPAAMAQELGIQEAFNEAKETGGDIKIPLSVWTERVINTEHFRALQNDVKFSPDAMTVNEVQAEERQIQEDLAKEEAAAREAEEAVRAEQERIKIVEDAKAVEESIASMLEATGRFDKSQIKQYATLFRERYAARAENRGLGETALGLFQRQNLDLVAPNQVTETEAPAAAQMQEPDIFDEVIASYSTEIPEDRSPEEKEMLRRQKAESKKELLAMAKQALIAIPDVSRDAVADALGLPRKEVRMLRGAPKRNRAVAIGTYSKEEIIRAARGQEEIYAQESYEQGNPSAARLKRAQKQGFDITTTWYHGTAANIESFDIERGRGDGGAPRGAIFLTKNPKVASNFAGKTTYDPSTGYTEAKDGNKGNVIPAYVSVKNTFDYQNKDHVDALMKALGKKKIAEIGKEEIINGKPMSAAEFRQQIELGNWNYLEDSRVMGAIKKSGFDSMNVYEYGEKNLAVFDPSSIRSVNAEFDRKKVDSTNILDQSGQASPRGRILFGNGQNIIELFEGSDASTVLHEAGHLWLEELITDATTEGVNPNLVRDLDTVLEWMGLEVRASSGRAAIKKAIQTEQHEMWARGFEAYLMEGKAPSQALRKAFARFKLWLTRIYKNIRGLDVDLNDDVRRVFDRLLVGETAAQAAEQELAFDPLFADPEAMGMNETQAARYRQARAEAHQATIDKIQARIMEDIARENKAWWKEESAKVRAEVEKEVEEMPEYRALDIIRNGLVNEGVTVFEPGEMKLSRELFRDLYGEEILRTMPKGVFGVKGEGLHPDVVAESVGMRDAGELVKGLSNLIEKDAYIEMQTEQRMKELYPELATSEELQEVARAEAMNTDRAKVLRMELEHLASNNLPTLKDAIRRITKRPPTEEAVRRQAEAMINKKALQEISPRAYQSAARRAAKEAGVLLARGDIEGAFEAKRRQLLNMELHRAAENAVEQKDKALERFKKLRKKDKDLSKTRDTDLVNAGRAILTRYGLDRAEKTADEYLAPMKAYDPEMYANVSEIVNGAVQNSKPYKEMSFDDFMGLADVIDSIWELSKTTREMEIEGKKVSRDEVKAALAERLEETGKSGPLPGMKQALSDSERRTKSIANLRNMITRVEHWAHTMDRGRAGGPFTKYIVRPILDATTRYRLKKVETLKTLAEIVKGFSIENPQAVIRADEIDYGFTKPELIMAILHSGNESNLKKLLLGRGWGEVNEDGTLDTSRWQAFLDRAYRTGIITESDMQTVQKIWDLNESMKPDAQKAHKRMFGFYFNEITAAPVRTPWGDFKGGYMPAIADQSLSMDANVRAGERIEDSPAQMFPTTGRGFTKARENNYSTPLSLDFTKIQNHIDKVLRFSIIEPAVKDATRLVKDRELRAQLNTHTSEVAKDLLEPWLVRAATQKSVTPGLSPTWDSILNWFRRTSTIQFMVLNVTNAIQNTTGLFPAASRVGAANLAGSFRRYLMAPKAVAEEVQQASDYMRSRLGQNANEFLREIDEVMLQPSKFQTFREWSINAGYLLDRTTNKMIEVVVWSGAYNHHLSQGLQHEQAVKEADATVRQTLAAMNPEDSSKFESGSPTVKLFTMFSGFFNTQANLLQSELTIAREEGLTTKEGSLRATRAYAYVVALPAIMSAVIMRIMAGEGLDEDDDGEYFDDVFDIFFDSQRRYATAFIPAGSVLNAGLNTFNKKPFDDRISPSPALSNLERAYQAPASITKAFQGGSVSKALKDGLTAFGLATGLPTAPLAKPLGYAADVAEGKAKPSGPIDAVRGAATGKRGSDK